MFQHTSVREAINSNDEGVHSTPSKCIDVLAELDKDDENPTRSHLSGSKRKSMMADDDMSDEEYKPLAKVCVAQSGTPIKVTAVQSQPTTRTMGTGKTLQKPNNSSGPSIEHVSVPAQVSDCKAKIAELQRWKEQRLQEEDYMGAHHLKQLIQEQELKLQTLRQNLSSRPTPSRAMAAPRVHDAVKPMEIPKGLPAVPAVSSVPTVDVSMGSRQVETSDSEDDEVMNSGSGVCNAGPSCNEEEDCAEEYERADEEDSVGQWRTCDSSGLVELVSETPGASFALDPNIFDKLYPYQRVGVAWMANLWQQRKGGILADEMGLGKTIQVCALLNGIRKAGATHALLLLPVSLLAQWAKEARIWCPGWPVYTYYGSASQRAYALRRISRPEGGVLLTSYSLLSSAGGLCNLVVDDAPSPVKRKGKGKGNGKRRRLDDDDGELMEGIEEDPVDPEIPATGLPSSGQTKVWDLVVCDEAHKMKNISTLLGKSIRQVEATCRILLTGTPVQNALQDLWSLLDFAVPGLLGNHATFVKHFSEPIDRGSVRGASAFAVQLKKHLSEQLRNLINPYLLRRTKASVGLICDNGEEAVGGDPNQEDDLADEDDGLDGGDATVKKLPPKTETIIWLAPTEEQITSYQKILEKSEVIREACAKTKLGVEVFRAIGLLKRGCNHPLLLLPTPKAGAWAELLADVLKSEGEGTSQDGETDVMIPSDATTDSLAIAGSQETDDARAGRAAEMLLRKLPRDADAMLQQSAKLRCLASLLPALASRGHRTLVFSQSLKMLDLIQICVLKPKGLRCLRLDGQTDALTRAEKVKKFQEQRDRFQCLLMTTATGGVGLNLTSADRVVMVDPAWNPATDAQAVDRAFRIGQEREVKVYRLIMSGLIEDKMFRLQVFKMGLTKTALEADQQHRYFSAREIKALFEWTDPSEGETRKLLFEAHGEESVQGIQQSAEDDGASEGWLAAGPAVGLSDFSQLYGAVAAEEEPEDECAAQIQEAQQRLGAADEKFQRMLEARQAAEAHRDENAKMLEESISSLELLKEKRAKAEEAMRERRSEVTQARRAEAAAQQKLEKNSRWRSYAQDQHWRAKEHALNAKELYETAQKAAADAANAAQSALEAFAKTFSDAQTPLSMVNDNGQAVGDNLADVDPEKLRKAKKACEKLTTLMETLASKQAELIVSEDTLLTADSEFAEAEAALVNIDESASKKAAELNLKSKEKDRQKAEQAQVKALQKVDAAMENILQGVQGVLDAGLALVDSFQKTQGRPVRVDQVKAAQSAAKAGFRQLYSMWQSTKRSRDNGVKMIGSRRKALQKASSTAYAELEAQKSAAEADRDHAQVQEEEQAQVAQRTEKENELTNAEALRAAAEAEETEMKQRRDDLKAARPVAQEAVRLAKAAEKEATLERQALHAKCSKVEKEQMRMEEAKKLGSENVADGDL